MVFDSPDEKDKKDTPAF